MDLTDPVVVYTLDNPVHADIIKNYLQSEGIRCRLDADRARKLIESHEIHRNRKETT
jgi:hypothetical protein